MIYLGINRIFPKRNANYKFLFECIRKFFNYIILINLYRIKVCNIIERCFLHLYWRVFKSIFLIIQLINIFLWLRVKLKLICTLLEKIELIKMCVHTLYVMSQCNMKYSYMDLKWSNTHWPDIQIFKTYVRILDVTYIVCNTL